MRQARKRLPHFLFLPNPFVQRKRGCRKITSANFTSNQNRVEFLLPDGFDRVTGRFPPRAAVAESGSGCEYTAGQRKLDDSRQSPVARRARPLQGSAACAAACRRERSDAG